MRNIYSIFGCFKTCFKNPNNPSCIDLLLTNRTRSFQNTTIIETGLADFNKIVSAVMKIYYKKQKSRIIEYRSHKSFREELFKTDLQMNFLELI